MAKKPSHVPQFGNWDSNDNMPYTAVFDQARIGKGGKIINPNDPAESNAIYTDNNINEGIYSGTTTKPVSQHRRRSSRDDGELGVGSQGGNSRHVRRASRGEEGFASYQENKNLERVALDKGGLGVSPVHAQSYQSRVAGRLGSASPAADRSGAPGTPNRSRQERYAAQLPKFGDWDVNNPGAGDGFTMIFDKARDEKKTGGAVRVQDSPFRTEVEIQKSQPTHETSKWFCSCFQPSTVT